MLQVPLALNDLPAAVEWTRAGVDGIGAADIQAIQIGNEPDLYAGSKGGQPRLDNQTYEVHAECHAVVLS